MFTLTRANPVESLPATHAQPSVSAANHFGRPKGTAGWCACHTLAGARQANVRYRELYKTNRSTRHAFDHPDEVRRGSPEADLPSRLPRRPERRLGLVEAIGHAAVRAVSAQTAESTLSACAWQQCATPVPWQGADAEGKAVIHSELSIER
jgi:hypothetical protein